ncbi:MAG: DUF2341 domain-containing protein, partial [Nitrospiraceae bacterium]
MHKKFIKILILALFMALTASLAAAPEAQAAFANVGSFCATNHKTSSSTWTSASTPALITTAQLDAGNLGVIVLSTDNLVTTDGNTTTHVTITDAAGNTWTKAREFTNGQVTAALGATVSVWYTRARENLASGAGLTVTLSGAITAKAVTCWEFTFGAGNAISVAGGNDAAEDADTNWVGVTVGSLASAEYLWVRGGAQEMNDATQWTGTAGFTNFTSTNTTGGTNHTNMAVRGEFRIATATTQTSDPTNTLATASDLASTMVAFREIVQPATLPFSYRKKITIDHTKVGTSGATTLTDYPFLFNVTDANLKTVSNGGHVSDVGSVAIDDTSSNVGTTTIDVTHVVSGTNRLMLVGVSGLGSTPTVTSVTWDFGGSNPVNFVANLVGTTNAGGVTVIRIFSLVAPDTGTKTLRVVTSGGNNSVGVMSFTGVHQTTPLGAFAANQSTGAANATVNVTSAAGELVFDTVAVEDEGASLAAHASQTQQWQLDSGPHGGGGSTEAGAATVTMSWVHPTAQWSIGGVSIKPASAISTAGNDIIFRALDATTCNDGGQTVCTLDHEIEQYDPATGKFVAWVRIPTVRAFNDTVDTEIYIYYGNSEMTEPTQNPSGVWDSNFVAVYHMNQDPSVGTDCAGGSGTLELCDSTATSNDGNMNGAMTASDLVAESSSPPAKIGKAIDFDGV